MSGLGIICYRDGRSVGRNEIGRMASALRIYGQEKQTILLAGPIGFAYTHFTNAPENRNENQPLTGGAGRFFLLFDGRLDNRDEIELALALSDNITALSDGALALLAWEKWGETALNRFVGEFAIIIWDAAEARLIAAKDQFGFRSLFYHETPTRMAIASAPKGIHALGDVERAFDEQKMADAMAQLYADGERSYYKDIKRLLPGHVLVGGRGRIITRCYYNIDEHLTEVRYRRDGDYVEAARELLDRAVQAQLRSVGSVGGLLSGGLDSSTVAVTALPHLMATGQELPTYTWIPVETWDGRTSSQNAYGDETPYVEAIANMHPGIKPRFVRADKPFDYRLDDFFFAAELPPRNVLNLVWVHAILEAAKGDGVTAMLSGMMGNMSLSWGGGRLLVYLWQNRRYRDIMRELWAHSKGNPFLLARRMAGQLLLPLGPDFMFQLWSWKNEPPHEGSRATRYSMIREDYVRAMALDRRAASFGENWFGRLPRDARTFRKLMLASRGLMYDYPDLLQGLRALYGIEIRDPMADRRLVEWCLSTPEDQYARNGASRWLIKRLMHERLPNNVLYNKRKGQQSCDWHARMSTDLRQFEQEVELLGDDADTRRMVDIARIRTLLDEWPQGTIVQQIDPRSFLLPISVPHAVVAGRFVRWVKGANR